MPPPLFDLSTNYVIPDIPEFLKPPGLYVFKLHLVKWSKCKSQDLTQVSGLYCLNLHKDGIA